jgi:hypothetical protein
MVQVMNVANMITVIAIESRATARDFLYGNIP